MKNKSISMYLKQNKIKRKDLQQELGISQPTLRKYIINFDKNEKVPKYIEHAFNEMLNGKEEQALKEIALEDVINLCEPTQMISIYQQGEELLYLKMVQDVKNNNMYEHFKKKPVMYIVTEFIDPECHFADNNQLIITLKGDN